MSRRAEQWRTVRMVRDPVLIGIAVAVVGVIHDAVRGREESAGSYLLLGICVAIGAGIGLRGRRRILRRRLARENVEYTGPAAASRTDHSS